MQGPITPKGIDRPNLLLRSEDSTNPGRRWVFRIELDTVLTDETEADELRELLKDKTKQKQAAGWLIAKRGSSLEEAKFILAAFHANAGSHKGTGRSYNKPRVVIEEDFAGGGYESTVAVDVVTEIKGQSGNADPTDTKKFRNETHSDMKTKIVTGFIPTGPQHDRARAVVNAAIP